MSKQYITIINDTFESIARKQYGNELEAGTIAKANPGVNEPLTSGIIITIPALSTIPENRLHDSDSDNINEVSLLIDGKRFRFWTDITITRAIDNMDTIEFSAPFDSNIDSENLNTFRKIFKPFSFKDVVISVGGVILFTGTMVDIIPVLNNDGKIVSVSCYSLPGVLNDCNAPASDYPLEFIGLNLKDIANSIIKPFGIGLQFNANPGAIFDLVAIEATETVLSFLTKLAKQRNLIISSTPKGRLLFHQSATTGNPVTQLKQGESPLLSVTPIFNPQQYYSSITGIESAITGVPGSQFTVKNPKLSNVLRPNTFSIPDTNTADVSTTVNARMGRMFANVVSYTIDVSTWRDSKGNLWKPNTTLILHAHDVMIYKNYEFVIRSVTFRRDKSSESATLNLVIPGSFEGKTPSRLPWDE